MNEAVVKNRESNIRLYKTTYSLKKSSNKVFPEDLVIDQPFGCSPYEVTDSNLTRINNRRTRLHHTRSLAEALKSGEGICLAPGIELPAKSYDENEIKKILSVTESAL